MPSASSGRAPADAVEVRINVSTVAFGGAGLGRLADGRVCFVHGVLPGEAALVRLTRERSSFVEGELVRLLEMSPQRVRPNCPVFGTCGGCAYQHASYPLQLEIKATQVRETLARIGKLGECDVRPVIASPREYGYRNRVSVHVSEGIVGFHGRHSRRLIPVAHCPIADESVNAALADLKRTPPARDGRFTVRGEHVAPGFSQVNPGVATLLGEFVGAHVAAETTHVVDAYCGAGFFSRFIPKSVESITGLEWSRIAIETARRAADPRERYLEGPVEERLTDALSRTAQSNTTLIVDPPAEGLSADAAGQIASARPVRLIYVSCHPATLARDLMRWRDAYRVRFVQPFDMFPQTAEIEVAAVCDAA